MSNCLWSAAMSYADTRRKSTSRHSSSAANFACSIPLGCCSESRPKTYAAPSSFNLSEKKPELQPTSRHDLPVTSGSNGDQPPSVKRILNARPPARWVRPHASRNFVVVKPWSQFLDFCGDCPRFQIGQFAGRSHAATVHRFCMLIAQRSLYPVVELHLNRRF